MSLITPFHPPEDVQRSLRALEVWREGRVRNPPRSYGYGRPLHEHVGTVLDWIAEQTGRTAATTERRDP